jgi:hypothetical protein
VSILSTLAWPFKKLYSILQQGEGNGFYHNSAVHMWSAAFISLAAYRWLPWWVVVGGWFLWAGVKEFYFDMRYELPPQEYGTLRGPGALNDFVAYILGLALGTVLYLI